MEQVLDWLNENELRAYPFIEEGARMLTYGESDWLLPDNFLLDLQLVAKTFELVENNGRTIPVFLKKIKYTQGGALEISFGTTTQTIEVFVVENATTLNYPLYSRTAQGNLAVFGEGISALLAFFNLASFEVFLTLYVEPSTCLQFNNAWLGVQSISATPEKVSKNTLDVGVARSYEPDLPILAMPQVTKLTGDVKLLEGYNCRINIANDLIDLEIGSSFGLNMNCSTSFLPSEYLDCGELVSYINGVSPDVSGNFKINQGSNIAIVSGNTIDAFSDPLTESSNAHTLFVGLTFQATDLCAPVNILPANT